MDLTLKYSDIDKEARTSEKKIKNSITKLEESLNITLRVNTSNYF